MSSTFMQCAIDGDVVIGIFRSEIHVRYSEAGVFSQSGFLLINTEAGMWLLSAVSQITI